MNAIHTQPSSGILFAQGISYFLYHVSSTTSYILLIYVFSPTADQISLIIYCVYVKPQLNGARTSGLVELLLIIQCKAFPQCSYLV